MKTQIPVTAVFPGNVEASDTTPPITGMSLEMDNGACTVVKLVRVPSVMRGKTRANKKVAT